MAESGGLLIRCGVTISTEGSNPSLSAAESWRSGQISRTFFFSLVRSQRYHRPWVSDRRITPMGENLTHDFSRFIQTSLLGLIEDETQRRRCSMVYDPIQPDVSRWCMSPAPVN